MIALRCLLRRIVVSIVVLTFGNVSQAVENPTDSGALINGLTKSIELLDVAKHRIQVESSFVETTHVVDRKGVVLPEAYTNSHAIAFKQSSVGFSFKRELLVQPQSNPYFGSSRSLNRSIIVVSNSKYRFELSKTWGKSSYMLEKYVLHTDDPDHGAKLSDTKKSVLASVDSFQHYQMSTDVFVQNLKSRDRLKVTSFSSEGQYAIAKIDSFARPGYIYRSKNKFDRDANYCLAENETVILCEGQQNRKSTASYEYQVVEGLGLLRRAKSLSPAPFDHPQFQIDIASDETYQCSLSDGPDENQFTLSHYGFPEPVEVEWKQPTPRYVWWLVGAFVCATIAIVCRVVLARRTRIQNPIPFL